MLHDSQIEARAADAARASRRSDHERHDHDLRHRRHRTPAPGHRHGVAITSLRLASPSRRFDRATGVWTNGATNWFTVTAFRSLAANVHKSLKKGDRIVVTGGCASARGSATVAAAPRSRSTPRASGTTSRGASATGSVSRARRTRSRSRPWTARGWTPRRARSTASTTRPCRRRRPGRRSGRPVGYPRGRRARRRAAPGPGRGDRHAAAILGEPAPGMGFATAGPAHALRPVGPDAEDVDGHEPEDPYVGGLRPDPSDIPRTGVRSLGGGRHSGLAFSGSAAASVLGDHRDARDLVRVPVATRPRPETRRRSRSSLLAAWRSSSASP